MRICLVSETWSPDINGVAHTLEQLSQELLARQYILQLIRPEPGDNQLGPRRASGVQAELQVGGMRVPGYREVRIGMPTTRRIQQFWRKQRPDVIYIATQGPLGWSARRAARRLSIPVVAGWHTNFDHYCRDYGAPWLATPLMRLLRAFHNGCAATLVPTRQQADDLADRGFQRLSVMGRGVNGTHFSPARHDPTLREQWSVGEHQPVALHVGRLASEKNLSLLQETYFAMREVRPDMALVIVGDGPARMAMEMAMPDVHFTGFVSPDELARHYASADLFVFPSLSETWGNVVPEAMASGLAVVAFHHAAAAELIENGSNGVSVATDDPHGFRDAAVSLCQQPALYARLGRAARLRALTCSWSDIADTFISVLEQAGETTHEATQPDGV